MCEYTKDHTDQRNLFLCKLIEAAYNSVNAPDYKNSIFGKGVYSKEFGEDSLEGFVNEMLET